MKQLIAPAVLLGAFAVACGYPAPDIHRKIEYWAYRFGLDPLLLAAVVWVESRYCVNAVSYAGAVGLGQVKPGTGKEMGVPPQYLYHPDYNLYASARYLRQMFLRFNRWDLALAAYNEGPNRVARHGVSAAGYSYTRKVLQTYWYWKNAQRRSR